MLYPGNQGSIVSPLFSNKKMKKQDKQHQQGERKTRQKEQLERRCRDAEASGMFWKARWEVARDGMNKGKRTVITGC